MDNKFTNKTILITGGAGFIGSHLTDALIEQGHNVSIIDDLSNGKKENVNPKAEFFKKDIRNFDEILPLFKGKDFVFHLAAMPRIPLSIKNPRETNEINITGTLNVLLAAKQAKVKKFIYSSSASIYGNQKELPVKENAVHNPLNPYAAQKYAGELYCKIFYEIYGLPTVCLRYFNVFGPRAPLTGAYATLTGIFLKQKENNEPLTIFGDGEQTRDFTYVSDVVSANILAMESDKAGKGEAINIGAGNNYSVNKVAEIIGGEKEYLPARQGEIKHILADISKAKQLLGWEPKYNLETGLKEMITNQ